MPRDIIVKCQMFHQKYTKDYSIVQRIETGRTVLHIITSMKTSKKARVILRKRFQYDYLLCEQVSLKYIIKCVLVGFTALAKLSVW